MHFTKRKTEDLIHDAQGAIGRDIWVVKPGAKIYSERQGRMYVPSTSEYSLFIQSNSGEADLMIRDSDINTIKAFLVGIEMGGSYKG